MLSSILSLTVAFAYLAPWGATLDHDIGNPDLHGRPGVQLKAMIPFLGLRRIVQYFMHLMAVYAGVEHIAADMHFIFIPVPGRCNLQRVFIAKLFRLHRAFRTRTLSGRVGPECLSPSS